MIVTINPSKISGALYAPASKSSMQRACAAALLTDGETIINNPGTSNDDLAALDVIQKLGATIIDKKNNRIVIKGKNSDSIINKNKVTTINCGESGLGLRMFAPIAALSNYEIILTGTGSLLQRPINFFEEIFPLLEINVQTQQGKLPVKLKGPLQTTDITIDGSLSSQFLTGLLLAYAKACIVPVTIHVKDLRSKPYIDLTLQVMKHFGWHVDNKNYEAFYFDPKLNSNKKNIEYTIESDWSSASFLLVAGAVAGDIILSGLDLNSAQADKAILDALERAGARITYSSNTIRVTLSELGRFDFDATDCPDLFPPLVALAAYSKGTTTIKGVHRLLHKESNRAIALQQEFKKMNVSIELQNDTMIIQGSDEIKGEVVHSHHDHRIAMACAVAALQASGATSIHDAEAINKSYPSFYDHLESLNTKLQKS